MRHKKQLNVRLDPATYEVIAELATGTHLNAFIEELVQQEVARRKGEVLDGKLLPVLRDMLFTYLAKEDSQFAMEVYEDAKAKVGKDIAARFNEGPA